MGVVLRPTSSACMVVAPRAKKFGLKQLPLGGVANTIIDGFIVRAVSDKQNCVVTILELPAFLMGVWNGLSGPFRYETSVGFSTPSMTSDITAGGAEPPGTVTYDTYFVGQTSKGVTIGSSHPWEGSVTVGSVAYVYASAILASAVPVWYEGGLRATTIVVFRTNAGIKRAYIPLVDPPPSRVPILGDTGNTGDGTIGYVSFGRELFYPTVDDLSAVEAGGCIEWGPRVGVVIAIVFEGVDRVESLKAVRYTIDDAAAAGAPLVGGVVSNYVVSSTTIPDAPTATTAIERLQHIDSDPFDFGYYFDEWAKQHAVVYGQLAKPGKISFPVDTGMSYLWAGSAGVGGAHEDVFSVVNVYSFGDEGVSLIARADYVEGVSEGVLISVQPYQYPRLVVYVVNMRVDGSTTFTKIHEHHTTRYNLALDPPGSSTKNTYYSLVGVNTLGGEPRIACLKHRVSYGVVPSTGVAGSEPDYRQPADITADSVAYSFVAPSGVETEITTPGYYIRASMRDSIFVVDTIVPHISTNTTRSAGDVSRPCCQYAPGVMAAIVSPIEQILSLYKDYHIALIDVETGVMTAVGPALSIGNERMAGGWLSCVEQGSVDESGGVVSHATLLLTVTHYAGTPGDVNGVYVTSDMGSTLGRVTNTAINTGMHYVGSPIGPARIGVSMTQ